MRENALAALRMIDSSAGEVSANCHTNHTRGGERVVRSPTDHWQFVTQLHHRRPDVIEELDLDDRLQTAKSHTSRAPDNTCFRQLRIKYSLRAKLALQPSRQLEDAALALDHLLAQVLFAAAVGNVFSENHNAFVPLHLIMQGRINEVRHGFGRWLLLTRLLLMTDGNLRIERC